LSQSFARSYLLASIIRFSFESKCEGPILCLSFRVRNLKIKWMNVKRQVEWQTENLFNTDFYYKSIATQHLFLENKKSIYLSSFPYFWSWVEFSFFLLFWFNINPQFCGWFFLRLSFFLSSLQNSRWWQMALAFRYCVGCSRKAENTKDWQTQKVEKERKWEKDCVNSNLLFAVIQLVETTNNKSKELISHILD
jgi:hypothetical protein